MHNISGIKDNGTKLSKYFLLAFIIILGIFTFLKLIPYLSGVLGALMFFFLFKNWMDKLVKKGIKEGWSAIILIVISFFFIVIPISGIILLLYSKLTNMKDNLIEVVDIVKNHINELDHYVGFGIKQHIDTSGIGSLISKNLQSSAGDTLDISVSIGLMYFLLYFMLVHRNELGKVAKKYMPMSNESTEKVYKESRDIIKANTIGIPLVAIFQGIIALIGFYIFGVSQPLFWFAITTIASVIPFIGTALGIVPVVVIMLSQGNTLGALGLLAYGVIVVGSTDNFVLRLFSINYQTSTLYLP